MDRRDFGIAAGLILLYVFGGMALGKVLPSPGDHFGDGIAWSFAIFAILLLVVVAATRGWRFVGLVGRDKKPAVRWIVVLFVLQLLILVAYSLLASTDFDPAYGSMALIAINIGFVAFNEELLFRGFLWGSLGGWGPVQRILAVSLLFGLFHLGNLLAGDPLQSVLTQVAFTFLAGIFDAVVRYGTGSLWPTIITHFLWDFGGILGEGSTADELGPIIQFITVAFGIIGLIAIAIGQRRAAHAPVAALAS